MSRNKNVAIALLIVGVIVLLVSAMADVIGVGASPLVFGYWQLIGSSVGLVLAIGGAVLYWLSATQG